MISTAINISFTYQTFDTYINSPKKFRSLRLRLVRLFYYHVELYIRQQVRPSGHILDTHTHSEEVETSTQACLAHGRNK